MSHEKGSRLGAYEIIAPLGAGGMGEVYRARDASLGRDVATKVLPAGFSADPDRLRRFMQEAQAAAALNHPNILAIYQVGEQDGAPYIVSELLEGATLGAALRTGALPLRKAIEYAVQVARGLAAAHDKGIVHRDLKPDNLFVTDDGRVKILDFGLAKLTGTGEGSPGGEHATMSAHTSAGTVLGTVGYMSPEQVRAQPVDARTDLFSLGAILYEMITGTRAFRGETAADTLSAILREEPPPMTASNRAIPPALERIVHHCLEKNPHERFQSARDLAFDLEQISPASASASTLASAPAPARARAPRWLVPALGAVALLSLGAAAGAFWPRHIDAAGEPGFTRLTFRRGPVLSARFAPDGKTVVYGAAWDGDVTETYLVTRDSPESRALGIPRSDVFAVSSSGELALAIRKGYPFPPEGATLARMPLLGGAAPRETKDHVEYADWGPDGSLAVTLDTGVGDRLEYPVGKMLYETPGPIHQIRVSPDGTLVAFQHRDGSDIALSVVDRAGKTRTLSTGWRSIDGLAWARAGNEVWFSAEGKDSGWALYAVPVGGQQRLLLRVPGVLQLHDVAADGRALVTRRIGESGVRYMPRGATQERDLSWLDASSLADVSKDGTLILLSEEGAAGGPDGSVYLRKTDGSAAVRLGSGIALKLSPDGAWALTLSRSRKELKLLPTGPGEPRALNGTFDTYWGDADWLPDGKRIVFTAMEPKHDPRVWVQDVASGNPRPISPEGLVAGLSVSPDGHSVATKINRQPTLLDLDGGAPRPITGLADGEQPVAWSPDGHALFVATGDTERTVSRLDLASGRRTTWKVLQPADRAGITSVFGVHVGGDEQSYAYSYTRVLSELYLVDGLK